MRNRFRSSELLKLLSLLEAHGIPAIPYKGPIMAASVYGDLALRQFSDLDILAHERDIPRAKELLLSQGYRPHIQLSGEQEATYLRSHREYQFVRDDGRVRVELQWRLTAHWQIMSSFPLDFENSWHRLRTVSLVGTTVRTLAPEDLLLFLCVHGSSHMWRRLSWLCDVAELVRAHQEMDWERLMERVRILGSERMLLIGLFLASDLLGTTLPEGIHQKVRAAPVVQSLAGQVDEWLFRQADDSIGLLEESYFFVRIRERPRHRVPYFLLYLRVYLRTAVTPNAKDRECLPLPEFLSPLYFLIRPVRLVVEYGLSPLTDPLKHLLGL